MSVCLCVHRFLAPLNVYTTLITEIDFVLNAKDFQLTDFCEKASFESYSLFSSFYDMAANFFVDMLTQHIDALFCMHTVRAH